MSRAETASSAATSFTQAMKKVKNDLVALLHENVEKLDESIASQLLSCTDTLGRELENYEAMMSTAVSDTAVTTISPMKVGRGSMTGERKPFHSPSSANHATLPPHGEQNQQQQHPPSSAVDKALKTLNLDELPAAAVVDEDPGSFNGKSGNLSQSGTGSRRRSTRQSVVWLETSESNTTMGNKEEEKEVNQWLSKTFSGYGSFRRQSKVQHSPGGDKGVFQGYLSFRGAGMPSLDLNASPSQDSRSKFSRPTNRHTNVFESKKKEPGRQDEFELEEDTATKVVTVFENFIVERENGSSVEDDAMTNEPLRDLQLRDISEATESHMFNVFVDPDGFYQTKSGFISVAASIFFRYTLFQTFQLRKDRVCAFLAEVYDKYNSENPFHNARRALSILHAVHMYLSQPNVAENFCDVEVLSVLVASVTLDVGHCGVTNEMLAKINHPLTSIYGDTCPMEQGSLALTFMLIEETRLFEDCAEWNNEVINFLVFREIVTEIMLGTAMRFHESLVDEVDMFLRDGIVHDRDIPKLLKAVVHAADLSFAFKPTEEHVHWIEAYVDENARQAKAEIARGLEPSVTVDRGDRAAMVAHGVLDYIVWPFLTRLKSVLPEAWMDHMEDNLAKYKRGDPSIALFLAPIEEPKEWKDSTHITIAPVLHLLVQRGSWQPSQQTQRQQQQPVRPQGETPGKSTHERNYSTPTPPETRITGDIGPDGLERSVRSQHYFAMLRLYAGGKGPGEIVSLAMEFEPLYIGEYARATASFSESTPTKPTKRSCIEMAQMIVETENAPTVTEHIASPTKRTPHTTDAFLLQLLHLACQWAQSPTEQQQPQSSSTFLSRDDNPSWKGSGASLNRSRNGSLSSGSGTHQSTTSRWRFKIENSVYHASNPTQ